MGETSALRFEQVGKTYGRGGGRVEAVRDLTLAIEGGQVFGFLGHNGAGKTTTIRMVMDLIRPTQGTVYVYGEDVRQRHGVLRRVGALVEGATFYNFLSGRRNLEVLARTAGVYGPARVGELLEQVGLSRRADSRVKGYSTGMKQRLGLAASLLADPDLVILDEPTNGLDPSGITEMRHFIRRLAHENGKTVFLSSHLLAEVEQMCDRVAIIRQGRLVQEGRVEDLLAGKRELRLEVDAPDHALDALNQHWPVTPDGTWVAVAAAREDAPQVIRRLVEHGVGVYQVVSHRQSLEDYFLSITGGGQAGEGAADA